MNKDRFKFRAWDKKSGAYDSQTTFILFDDGTLGEFDYGSIHNQDWYVVEQCTGLKDKNGNLIYEGDLIKSPNNSHALVVCRMANGVYGCKICCLHHIWEMNLFDLIKNYDIEIIGNIHEQKDTK